MTDLLALTIRQPWVWCILHAGKDIENRTWPTRVRGTVAVHAAKGMTWEEYDDGLDVYRTACGHKKQYRQSDFPLKSEIDFGGIVGLVDIVDCVTASTSPWFFGPVGFALANPRPLPFTPCKGALGFWRVPNSIREMIHATA